MENEPTRANSSALFQDLHSEVTDPTVTEVESFCVNCGKNGVTRLLLTKIPYYKEVILMSFHCEYCGYQNNELERGGSIQEKGIKIVLRITSQQDLNRQVVKSDFTSIKIPSLDFEIPAQSQKGEITSIEGIIERCISGLKQDQVRRKVESATIAQQIDEFLKKLEKLKSIEKPFIIIFEDILGECYIENPNAPSTDHGCEITFFKRTKEQDKLLGIYSVNETQLAEPVKENEHTLEDLQGEVLTFPTSCPECNSRCETNMKLTKIPHFREVVIMATNCDCCGHKTNEVKSGSGIEPLAVRIEVTVAGKDDFVRDLLKSETCYLMIPELELEIGPTALSGRFTTVEGIIVAIKDQLSTSTALTGDSVDPQAAERMQNFIYRLNNILDGKSKITLVLDDPAGNSYVQSLREDGLDDRLKIVKYERTFEQNEDLGLNDMKVENY